MRSKTGCYFLTCLMVISIVSSSCAASQSQPTVVQTSPTIEATVTPVQISPTTEATATPVPATFIPTPTWGLNLKVGTTTPTPTATPTFVLPTLPPDCGKVKLGRAGTQVIDHEENILIQGIAIMCGAIHVDILQSMFDLDTGTFNAEDADLQFCPRGSSLVFYWFCDVNQAAVKPYGAVVKDGALLEPKLPLFEECLKTQFDSSSIGNEPQYACVMTNSGNISRVKVERRKRLYGTIFMSLEISFITWKK